jgi:hypothetical protein
MRFSNERPRHKLTGRRAAVSEPATGFLCTSTIIVAIGPANS